MTQIERLSSLYDVEKRQTCWTLVYKSHLGTLSLKCCCGPWTQNNIQASYVASAGCLRSNFEALLYLAARQLDFYFIRAVAAKIVITKPKNSAAALTENRYKTTTHIACSSDPFVIVCLCTLWPNLKSWMEIALKMCRQHAAATKHKAAASALPCHTENVVDCVHEMKTRPMRKTTRKLLKRREWKNSSLSNIYLQ